MQGKKNIGNSWQQYASAKMTEGALTSVPQSSDKGCWKMNCNAAMDDFIKRLSGINPSVFQ